MISPLVIIIPATLICAFIAFASKQARPFAAFLAIGGLAIAGWHLLAPQSDAAAGRALETTSTQRVNVTVTSDPPGARVTANGVPHGVTPATFETPVGLRLDYRVEAEEPYDEYDLYMPYRGSITPTEDVAIDVWLERTTAEQQAEQRTARAEAKERERLAALQSELDSSSWRLYRSRDPITDADRSYIITYATQYPTILERDANLIVRCDRGDPTSSDGIALYIDAEEYLGSRDLPIDWRFDDNPPVQKQTWRPSTDGVALFNVSYKTTFLTQMLEAGKLSARLYDYRGVGHYYEFDVAGARAALTLLGCYRGPAL